MQIQFSQQGQFPAIENFQIVTTSGLLELDENGNGLNLDSNNSKMTLNNGTVCPISGFNGDTTDSYVENGKLFPGNGETFNIGFHSFSPNCAYNIAFSYQAFLITKAGLRPWENFVGMVIFNGRPIANVELFNP